MRTEVLSPEEAGCRANSVVAQNMAVTAQDIIGMLLIAQFPFKKLSDKYSKIIVSEKYISLSRTVFLTKDNIFAARICVYCIFSGLFVAVRRNFRMGSAVRKTCKSGEQN
jgi:hypothetical protein